MPITHLSNRVVIQGVKHKQYTADVLGTLEKATKRKIVARCHKLSRRDIGASVFAMQDSLEAIIYYDIKIHTKETTLRWCPWGTHKTMVPGYVVEEFRLTIY